MTWCTLKRLGNNTLVRSLCWRGDDLVDWVSGGNCWTPTGRFVSAHRNWGYERFDAAVSGPMGRWAVVYERTGTAGIVLFDGEIVREIHRSPYHADAFLYPVCLFPGPDDRMLLAHCPDSYARIEIDDAKTGARLTQSESRQEVDFFHSRLAVSPSQKRLLSAGWMWQPWDVVVWFDLAAVLADPTLLDQIQGATGPERNFAEEESSAAWLNDDTLLIGGAGREVDSGEDESTDAQDPEPRLHPDGIAVYDVVQGICMQDVRLEYPPGMMMPAGPHHVLTFFQCPRLVSLRSGRVVHEWPNIDTGAIISSIVRDQPLPVVALDAPRARFAVATTNAIEVITLDPVRLPD